MSSETPASKDDEATQDPATAQTNGEHDPGRGANVGRGEAAETPRDGRGDPADDPRAEYDYAGGEVAQPDLVEALRERIAGEVRFDEYTRQLYATDASAYETLPVGVVFPTTTDDVARVVSHCHERGIPVLPRGGGTSLAGQTINEAVVLDFTRHMDSVVSLDAEAARATVEPGCILEALNESATPHGLKFAPDPAWGDKSAIGGAIGNNSTGAHSLVYGKTDHYIERCEAVLADGTVTEFGPVEVDELRERADPDGGIEARIASEVVTILDEDRAEIRERYPTLKRNVSGYNLDRLVAEAEGEYGDAGVVNLARLLAGSEGTLAIVTRATVSLEPTPETKAVALLCYDSLSAAMEDVAPILEHDPAAVEVMDDTLLELARDTPEFADVVGLLPDGTDSVLLVEYYADSDETGQRKVADLLADRAPMVTPASTEEGRPADTRDSPEDTSQSADDSRRDERDSRVDADAPIRATNALEAHDADRRATFWKMRKSGLPILLSRTSDAKHISFIEDCAVPADQLPTYVAEFQSILSDTGTFASFYAHAGPGVLHVRPLIDTKTVEGVEQLREIADRVTDLVVSLGGAVSGEHGDGRARTVWNRKLYGDRLWQRFRSLKTAFDPDWILNPGSVCGDHDPTENLRFDPEYTFEAGFEPTLAWEDDNGMAGMAELCHGCGGCRGEQPTTGGVMCPTYRAIDEEIQSTRGRANALRAAMSGSLPDDPTDEQFRTEVLDLCIGCKGCKMDCPSGVDMAKLKAEVSHAHRQDSRASLRDRLFADVNRVARWGSRLAPLSNWLARLPVVSALGKRLIGVADERDLPWFHRETFRDWYEARGPTVERGEADRVAVLVADTYTDYTRPAVGRAAVETLEAAGVRVELADTEDTGRAAHSLGFLERARERSRGAIAELAPAIRNGKDVVVIEPSEAVMLQDDLLDLHGGRSVATDGAGPVDGDTDSAGAMAEGVAGDGDSAGGDSTGSARGGSAGAASSVPDGHPDAPLVATNSYGLMEYLDTFRLDESLPSGTPEEGLAYHGHCHQKATAKDHHAVGVLRRVGYDVEPVDSTCCGMAGSFGYEAEHYSMSQQIADLLVDRLRDTSGTVVAPGASCRTQLEDRDETDGAPPHPIEKVARVVRSDGG